MELKIISDVFASKIIKSKSKKPQIKEILVKRDGIYRKSIQKDKIISVTEIFDKKGEIVKDKCFVNIENEGIFTVSGSYKKITEEVFEGKKTKIGF